MTKRQTVCGS